MDKRKLNLWTDRVLFPALVGLCGSGIGLHVYGHWAWCRSLATAGCKGLRRWMVVLLAVVFLAVAVTGIVKWLFGAHIGFYHYVGGLALGVLALLRIIRRWRPLFGRGRNSATGKGR
ncbi:hypothetical protein [Alistipes sp. An116]|uniref:hypothetical protein n=1 Tax=Alistipes sp. An116 TaxID=1965546 RepID=UPI001178941A|nr:hypothetical protein [Alistipes sp. An116]